MRHTLHSMLALSAILAFSAGCSSEPAAPPAGNTAADSHADDHGHGHDEHEHADEGPHHGHLIELGDEEYHAELVHSHATHKVDLHLLDSTARKDVAAPLEDVTLNIVIDGKPAQYKLTASPLPDDAKGQSSRFSLIDEALSEALEEKTVKVQLNVTLNDKPYSGSIDHAPHEEHDHDHK